MKSKYFLTALLMIAMALFVGCHEDEEDQASNALVGDWYAEYAAPLITVLLIHCILSKTQELTSPWKNANAVAAFDWCVM